MNVWLSIVTGAREHTLCHIRHLGVCAPYLDPNQTLYIDAKSGVSGAGKKLVQTSHFVTINENLFAYSPISHRHSPEINEQLKKIGKTAFNTFFVPHLIPLTRGMLDRKSVV